MSNTSRGIEPSLATSYIPSDQVVLVEPVADVVVAKPAVMSSSVRQQAIGFAKTSRKSAWTEATQFRAQIRDVTHAIFPLLGIT